MLFTADEALALHSHAPRDTEALLLSAPGAADRGTRGPLVTTLLAFVVTFRRMERSHCRGEPTPWKRSTFLREGAKNTKRHPDTVFKMRDAL